MNWAGKHVASSKIAKNDTAASDDAERAEQFTERCAELLRVLPIDRSRDPHNDGPWIKWYGSRPEKVLVGLKRFIFLYLWTQRISREPDDSQRRRKDYDDMHKAAVKFAASIRRVGIHNLQVDLDDADPPHFEALFAMLESATRWMERNPSKNLYPSRSWIKGSARRFVEGVIVVVASYTGKTPQQDTKGTPTAELKVLKEIVATVDPAIGGGTITEAIKRISKSGLDWSGGGPWSKGVTVD
jgi:hypothetical protein